MGLELGWWCPLGCHCMELAVAGWLSFLPSIILKRQRTPSQLLQHRLLHTHCMVCTSLYCCHSAPQCSSSQPCQDSKQVGALHHIPPREINTFNHTHGMRRRPFSYMLCLSVHAWWGLYQYIAVLQRFLYCSSEVKISLVSFFHVSVLRCGSFLQVISEMKSKRSKPSIQNSGSKKSSPNSLKHKHLLQAQPIWNVMISGMQQQ